MTGKRFTTNGYKIYDTYHDGVEWLVNNVEARDIVEVMNNLDIKSRERSKALSKLQKENEGLKQFKQKVIDLFDEKLEQSFNNRIAYDENDSSEFYKGYHCAVSDLKKEVEE